MTGPAPACFGWDPEIWWLPEHEEQAKRICRKCPLIGDCLDVAIERREKGVWGGTTEAEREMVRGQAGDEPDIDQVVIERRTLGDRAVPMNRPERLELVRRWHAAGKPLGELQRTAGVAHVYRDMRTLRRAGIAS